MEPSKQNFSMEAAGSLVPELEGARRSMSHPRRFQARSKAPAEPERTFPRKNRGEDH